MKLIDTMLDLLGICGVAAIGVGLWQIYEPAAYIGMGCIMIVASILWSKGRQ